MEIVKEHCSLAIVVVRNQSKNRILMIKNHSGWVFPKGHIEKGESEEAAARRECKEESGVDIDQAFCHGKVHEFQIIFDHTHIKMTKNQFLAYAGGDAIEKTISAYCFELDSAPQPKVEEGFIEGCWLNESEAFHFLCYEENKMALMKAINKLKGNIVQTI